MKKIISSITVLLLIIFIPAYSFSGEPSKSITYSFSFKEASNNKLLVECTFQGNKTGITKLILPYQWANQLELYKNIDELNCVEYLIEDTDQPHIKIIHHNANELITINYTIKLLSENINHENYYRPIGNHSYFYAIGHGMFVIPAEQDSKMAITLKWNDIPKDWKIANSFGQQQVLQEIEDFPNVLHSGAFLAGDFQIIECNPGTNPVYIAIRGNWPFSAEEFTALVEQIFISQRDFWNDHEFPYYLVSVIPIDTKNSTGGTALRDNFSLFLGDNYFSKDDYIKHLGWLISHEHFHTWNGCKFRSSEPEGSMYWFSEGFTEYYAVKLNRKNGIMSQKEYVDHVNGILMDYFSSPVHNASNETITKNFWTNPATGKLPYDRGFALALYLDTKIQSNSEGLSLDNFMHDLLEFTKQKDAGFSFDDLLNLFANYVDQEDLRSIKKFVIEGDSIPIFHHAMGSEYHLEWEDSIGFNLRESLAKGIVQGVTYGSIPHQAGLANRLKIVAFSRTGTVVTVTVMDEKEGSKKNIAYDLKELKQIPQYVNQTQAL